MEQRRLDKFYLKSGILRKNMNYNLDLNDRPFSAIKAGTKKIETRVPTSYDKTPYGELKAGDTLTFTNNATSEVMGVEILRVAHYSNLRILLETEGIQNTLSSGFDIDQAVKGYNAAFPEYEKNIPKYGIYAFSIKVNK